MTPKLRSDFKSLTFTFNKKQVCRDCNHYMKDHDREGCHADVLRWTSLESPYFGKCYCSLANITA